MSEKTYDTTTRACSGSAAADEEPLVGEAAEGEADETTGASPGTAQACEDLGLNSLASNLDRFGIKPPGQA